MDKIEILERLISIKNNADERSHLEARINPCQHEEVIRAYILQQGIEELIISIQNTCLEELMDKEELINYKGKSYIKSLLLY